MNKDTMPQERTTISLSKEDKTKLEKLAKSEHRPVSQQIVHMMEFYIKNKEK
jgi:hypothetical protein